MATTQDLNNAVNTVTQAVNANTTAVNNAVTAIQELQAQIASGGVDPTAAISQLGSIASTLTSSTNSLVSATPTTSTPTPAPAPSSAAPTSPAPGASS